MQEQMLRDGYFELQTGLIELMKRLGAAFVELEMHGWAPVWCCVFYEV